MQEIIFRTPIRIFDHCTHRRGKICSLSNNMSQVNTITSCKINIKISSEGGNSTYSHLIHAAQFIKQVLNFVECIIENLNKRFFVDSYDVTSMKFTEDFITNVCNFDEHLNVHVQKNIQNIPTSPPLKGMRIVTFAN